MKIVHVCQFFDPARGYQDVFLSDAQCLEGHEVSVISSRLSQSSDLAEVDKTKRERFAFGRERRANGTLVVRLEVGQISTRLFFKGLGRELEALAPDWIIVHGISTLLAVQVVAHAIRTGFVGRITVDDHTTAIMRRRTLAGNVAYGVLRNLVVPLLRLKCRDFVAVTPETVFILRDDMGIPQNEIRQISLGADPEKFRPSDPVARQRMRHKLEISEDALLIVSAGRLEPAKRVLELISAVRSLRGRYPHLGLLLIGQGGADYTAQVAAEIDQCAFPPGHHVWKRWIPNDELGEYLACADIGAWPGNESAVHLEAMACGIPIVIRNLGSLTDRVEAGNGLMTDGSVDDIERKLETLLCDRDLRLRMGRLGRQKIECDLSWRRIAQRFEATP